MSMLSASTSWTPLLELLFEEPTVGRCLVAPDGSVLRANAEWLRSSGLTLDGALGADIVALFPGTRDMALALHARARAGHHVEVPRHAQLIHGRETWWEGAIDPVPMDGGTGLLITAREVGPDTPPRGRAADALRESESRCRAIFDSAYDAIFVADPDDAGRLLSANPAACRLFGYDEQELCRLDRAAIVDPGDPNLPAFLAARDAAGRSVGELTFRRKDGSRFVGELASSVFLDASGRRQAVAIVRDVTDRKGAAEALQAEKDRYRSLFDHSLDAVYLATPDGAILDANDAACRMHGMTLDELKQRGRAGLVVNDERHAAALRQRRVDGRVRAEMTDLRKDGTTFPVEVESVLLDPRRPDSPAFVIARDITDRERVERERRDSEEQARRRSAELEAVLDAIPAAVFITRDPDARTIDANRFCTEMLRLPPRTNVSKSAGEADQPRNFVVTRDGTEIPPEELPVQRAARGEEVRGYELDLVFEDGDVRHLLGNARPLPGPDGAPAGAVGAFVEITEQKRAERALREAHERLRVQVDAMNRAQDALRAAAEAAERSEAALAHAGAMANLGAWWIDVANPQDLDANPLRWSDEVYRIFGYEPGEVPVSNALFFAHVHPDDRQRVSAAIAHALATRQRYVVEHRVVRRDGVERVVLEHGAAHHDGDGRLVRIVGAVQDVTERKRAEDELRLADQRKSEFLGVLSHELRNPLAPIRNSVHLLERAPAGSAQAARAREVIRRQTEHLTRLVDDLLDVTRISRGKIALQRSRLDLREIVWTTADDLRSVFAEGDVELRLDLASAPVWVDADATRLSQVVGNLLQNATKFTPRGGVVEVLLVARDGAAELRVRDDGVGMDPGTVERMFEPFAQADHTLARSAGGLGLGLALVKALVQLHGGEVEARSEGVGKGAEFLVRVPLAPSGVDRSPAARDAGRREPLDILVIEDNADAAQSLADVLELDGHRVTVARDGRSGLELARALRPAVVLCDIGLPDLDGYAVARALRREPSLGATRLVALSGYAQPEDRERAREAGFDAHLPKPPDLDELKRVAGAER